MSQAIINFINGSTVLHVRPSFKFMGVHITMTSMLFPMQAVGPEKYTNSEKNYGNPRTAETADYQLLNTVL